MILKKRKTKSVTPIVIALTQAQKESLKRMLQPSVKAFQENRATPTDWHNLGFRLKVGLEVAKECYSDENVGSFETCMDLILKLKERALTSQGFTTNSDEFEILTTGLEAVDEMQDQVTRRVLLDKHLIADRFMKRLANT